MSSLLPPSGQIFVAGGVSLPIYLFPPLHSMEARIAHENLRQLITKHGGKIVPTATPECVPVVPINKQTSQIPASHFVGLSFVYSDRWIHDSVRRRCLQKLEDYKYAATFDQQSKLTLTKVEADESIRSPVAAAAPVVSSAVTPSRPPLSTGTPAQFAPSPSKSTTVNRTPVTVPSSAAISRTSVPASSSASRVSTPHSAASHLPQPSHSATKPQSTTDKPFASPAAVGSKRKLHDSTPDRASVVPRTSRPSPTSSSSSPSSAEKASRNAPPELARLPPPPPSNEIRRNVLALKQMTGQPLDVVLHALMALNGNFSAAWDYLTGNEHENDERPWTPEEDTILQWGSENEFESLVKDRTHKECIARLLFLRPRRELERTADWTKIRRAFEMESQAKSQLQSQQGQNKPSV